MNLSPIQILQARAQARALLHAAGIYQLEEAMAPLRDYAVACGLADEIGAQIIHSAFGITKAQPNG